jgi:predicted membrane protein
MERRLEKIFWGLFFIFGAAFILVSQLGYLQDVNVFTLLFAVFLAACFLKSLIHVEFTGMLFSLAFLAIIFDHELRITAITPWPVLGAALLGSIGLNIIFHKHHHYYHSYNHKHFEENFETVDVEDGSKVNYGTSFGSSIKYVNSDDFKQANLHCSFGAMKVYFDNAVIQSGSAVINLQVSFSGVELYIPKEWKIVNHAGVSLGAITEKNRPQSNDSPVVTITGSASFSGIEIIYV